METMGGPWSWAGPTAWKGPLMAVSEAGQREAASLGAHQLGPGIISEMGRPGRAQVPRDAVEAGVGVRPGQVGGQLSVLIREGPRGRQSWPPDDSVTECLPPCPSPGQTSKDAGLSPGAAAPSHSVGALSWGWRGK